MPIKWTDAIVGSVRYIKNAGGPTLGCSLDSGVQILTVDGLAFKDLSKDGEFHPYEDWRLSPEERARDLASRLTVEQMAGLMVHTSHQAVPADRGWAPATYGGKPYQNSGAKPYDLTDQQIALLAQHVRHVLMTVVESPETAARWNNGLQAWAEGTEFGIPVSISSDPRHAADASREFNAGAGGTISMWPESLGIAATFDPSVSRTFGDIASKEYRALGITTALSPQIDIATDPRWSRFGMTFGEDPELAADMARAYIDGFQTSAGADRGWGWDSVNAMAKHWPGGGSGEGGRDAHFGYGKYAVYPGNNFLQHLTPFLQGAFQLTGPTAEVAAVMPYYTISFNQDTKHGKNVGNAYSAYFIQDLLRERYGYDGVVCTDWGITDDPPRDITALFPGGRSWGMEAGYTVAERHYRLLMAGVDQIGGAASVGPLLEAYRIGVSEHGEAFMRRRFERSSVRILKNLFQVGLFENPYLVPEQTAATVGAAAFMEAGYEAQRRSIVLLKNLKQVLPLAKGQKVYIPRRYRPAGLDWFGRPTPAIDGDPVNLDVVRQYFEVVDRPEDADAGLVFIESPYSTTGYSKADAEAGGNGYVPISLQYRPYTANRARQVSLAGDPRDVENRSYQGKTVTVANASDLDSVLRTKELLGDTPVIVSLTLKNPTVVAEFEPEVSALLVSFGVQDQAVLDILTGTAEPSALLPCQMPADMDTVEDQDEDVPHDMRVHVDTEGNAYDFGFGLNWRGVIRDARWERYGKRPAAR
jgi:beta-glucosidase